MNQLWAMRNRLAGETMTRAKHVMRLLRGLAEQLRELDANRRNNREEGVSTSTLHGIAWVIDQTGDKLGEDAARLYGMIEGLDAGGTHWMTLRPGIDRKAETIQKRVAEIRARRDGIRDRETEQRYRAMFQQRAAEREAAGRE
jgi:hypothetical protein